MDFYSLCALAIVILLGVLSVVGAVMNHRATKRAPDDWHPMLVRHGNLIESEDTL